MNSLKNADHLIKSCISEDDSTKVPKKRWIMQSKICVSSKVSEVKVFYLVADHIMEVVTRTRFNGSLEDQIREEGHLLILLLAALPTHHITFPQLDYISFEEYNEK